MTAEMFAQTHLGNRKLTMLTCSVYPQRSYGGHLRIQSNSFSSREKKVLQRNMKLLLRKLREVIGISGKAVVTSEGFGVLKLKNGVFSVMGPVEMTHGKTFKPKVVSGAEPPAYLASISSFRHNGENRPCKGDARTVSTLQEYIDIINAYSNLPCDETEGDVVAHI